jgi:hypothetical protein
MPITLQSSALAILDHNRAGRPRCT